MNKLILPGSFQWGDTVDKLVTLADVHSRGLDQSWTTKHASVFSNDRDDICPEKGTSVLHVIAMGASERYGPNRNADGFKRAMLDKTHPTFVTDAYPFISHVNHDPKLASGTVLKSAYNKDMDRVELLVRVKDAKWDGPVQAMANGGDFAVSMSIQVPYDVCVICNNKSARRTDYCDCMKKMAGRVLADHRQVYVDNPTGKFIDISWIPGRDNQADRIAFGLSKVASAGVTTGAQLYEMYRNMPLVGHNMKSARAKQKKELLGKLAAMEKEIEGYIESGESSPIMEMRSAFSPEIKIEDGRVKEMRPRVKNRLQEALSQFADVQVSLPLREFVKLVLPEYEDQIEDAEDLLPGVFSAVEDDEDVYNSDAYDCDCSRIMDAILPDEMREMISKFSLGSPVGTRAKITIIRGAAIPKMKRASVKMASAGAIALAREYATYKVALLDRCAADPVALRLGVLQNYCQ